ncbi:hypothetical protein LP420_29995 [Massilia sp. B-10]|nr:hypothetical protein LP420_29995 [Massilia sp. B-10]
MTHTTTLAALCALGLSALAQAQEPVPVPETSWVGQFSIGGQSTAIVLHERSGAPGALSSLDVPSKGAREIPLKNFSLDQRLSHFELQGGPDLFTFDGKRSAKGISGTVRQGAQSGKFELVALQPAPEMLIRNLSGSYRLAPGHVIDMGPMDELGGQLAFLDNKTRRMGPLQGLSSSSFVSGPSLGMPYPFAIRADFVKDKQGVVTAMRWTEGKKSVLARKIAPHRVEDVTVANGDVTLKGTLLLPQTPGPHPAIVFAHGSGPATRNVGAWNTFFVRQGIAVLSLDKRGAGASGGDWTKASLATIADDWLAGVGHAQGARRYRRQAHRRARLQPGWLDRAHDGGQVKGHRLRDRARRFGQYRARHHGPRNRLERARRRLHGSGRQRSGRGHRTPVRQRRSPVGRVQQVVGAAQGAPLGECRLGGAHERSGLGPRLERAQCRLRPGRDAGEGERAGVVVPGRP